MNATIVEYNGSLDTDTQFFRITATGDNGLHRLEALDGTVALENVNPRHARTIVPGPAHVIPSMSTRLSVAAQMARSNRPDDCVYLLPAIAKVPETARTSPLMAEYNLMSIERITGCIDDAYFQRHVPKHLVVTTGDLDLFLKNPQ